MPSQEEVDRAGMLVSRALRGDPLVDVDPVERKSVLAFVAAYPVRALSSEEALRALLTELEEARHA